MNSSGNKRHSLGKSKPPFQVASSRIFNSAMEDASRSRRSEPVINIKEKEFSIQKESNEKVSNSSNSKDRNYWKCGTPRVSSKIYSQTRYDYDHSSKDLDAHKYDVSFSKFDSSEDTAVLENSSGITRKKEDDDYSLPIKNDDMSILSVANNHKEISRVSDYNLPIYSPTSPALYHTSYVSSNESCLGQKSSQIEKESDSIFDNEHSNRQLNEKFNTPLAHKGYPRIPSPVDPHKTQGIPSICANGKNFLFSSNPGYLSNDSPASNSFEYENIVNSSSSTHERFLKKPCSPSSFTPKTPLSSTVNTRRDTPKDSPSPSVKRSYSYMSSDNSPDIFYPPGVNLRNQNRRSLGSNGKKTLIAHRHRRSTSDLQSPVTKLSYKFSSSNITPLQRNSRCVTDQSPYSPQASPKFSKRMRTSLPYYDASELITFKSKFGFIDSHCHLDFLFERHNFTGTYAEYQAENKESFPESYKGCVAVFCNPFTFSKISMWEEILKEDNVWAAFGCHPHNSKDYNEEIENGLLTALKHPRVRALGEIGLDYSTRNNCPKEIQKAVFIRQLKIAVKKKFPLVIHCREALEDGLKIMKEEIPTEHFIHLHCFTDLWYRASQWLESFPNLFIGLTNVVTFPSAESVHEVARKIPLERLLIETDTPYFFPKTITGETRLSHPGMAIHVAAQIAALRGESLDIVLKSTIANTRRMYGIKE